jgi:hypothetical protein
VKHPFYCRDLALGDFVLYVKMKENFCVHFLTGLDDFSAVVNRFLSAFSESFQYVIFQEWIERLQADCDNG